ncbi:pilus assembly protein [Dyella silvatica]|uniref:pilus assembly protein n=1 Tax=Dyella silvatica TaxID=2992128 RepID=UPI00224DF3BD|nr:PilC/PilY family type IV pilus protein [Dyella silvatica]
MTMHRTSMYRRQSTVAFSALLSTLLAGISASSMAGTVELSPGPPTATTSVAPNLVLTFDDSGSMNWHHMPDQRPYTGAAWNTGADTSQTDVSNRTYPSRAAPFLCASVITPGVSPGTVDPADARTWSMNGVYFNPDNKYDPPLKADGTTMPNASFGDAWDNGIQSNRPGGSDSATRDLSSYGFCGNRGAGYYRYTGNKASLPLDSNGQLTTSATSNLYASANWTWVSLSTNADKQNFANWYAYYRTRTMAAVTAISRAYSPFKDNVRVAWQNINSNFLSNNTAIYKFVDDSSTNNVRTRFYTWLFNMSASGGTPNRTAAMRVGDYFSNRTGAVDSNPYWDSDVRKELVCRQNFHIQMTDGMWNGDTPSQPTPHDRSGISSLPDGLQSFSVSDRESKVVWNESSNSTATMADIAFKYWASDLQAGVTGNSAFAKASNRLKVPANLPDQSTPLFKVPLTAGADPRTNKEIYWNPANDPASWPHLVQYMIGFGASGTLSNNSTTYQSLRSGDTAWPVPLVDTDDGKKIDDMWHAALNSRGKFFAASNPTALITALTNIISSIVSRNTTSVAGSLSTAVLGTATVTFQAGYDTNDWSGSMLAKPVGTDGIVGSGVLWNGRAKLDTRAGAGDTRVILTSTGIGSGHGAAFTWASAATGLRASDANFDKGGIGASRLAWLRGDKSKEGASFRQRNSVFGAVINGQALYLAAPTGGYRDSWPSGSPELLAASKGKSYEQFRADHLKRAPTVYVAANDGMLHAFDATTDSTDASTVDIAPAPGTERWAYVPYSAYGRLSGWSSLTDFSFMPSVDGTPVSRDVYFDNGTQQGWHTILAAGLRLGGRGVYALDITEAAATQGSTSGKVIGPADKVLWEFNNSSDGGANLGYTFGRPNIGRLASGQWVVLVPGGYFPKDSTDPAINNTFSSLFVLDAQSGKLLRELKTPTSVAGVGTVESYGLTTPVIGDYDSDQIDDVAFAGDLQGNVWRFDLTNPSPDQWAAELFFSPKTPGERPITVMPRLFPDPTSSGFMVVFGSGKYLGGSDNTIDDKTKTQAVYGIRDAGVAGQPVVIDGNTATPLVQQLLTEVGNIRGLSSKPVPAKNTNGTVIRGWYFNLDVATAKGERVVVDATALFDTNRAIITTLIPQNNDPCDPAPKGALMVIDAATGAAGGGVNFGTVDNWPGGYAQAGARVSNPPTGGFLSTGAGMGGGRLYVPGVTLEKSSETDPNKAFSFGDAIWRRRSWRVLNNDQ